MPKIQDVYKYLFNESSKQEAELIQQWIADPSNEEEANAILEEYFQFHTFGDYTDLDLDSIYSSILSKIEEKKLKSIRDKRSRLFKYSLMAAAAVLLLLLFYPLFFSEKTIVIKAKFGEVKTISLPDGSVVTLNSNSTLYYSTKWDTATVRDVYLTGEAFFDVKHLNDNRKFRVIMNEKFVVEVLGTKFSVYKRYGETRVVLNSGKIKIDFEDKNKTDLLMQPGELVQIDDYEKVYPKKQVKAEDYSSWKERKIVFNGSTMKELEKILKEIYNITLVVESIDLNDKLIYGTLPNDDKEILIAALETILNVRAKLTNDTLIISKK